MDTKDCQPLFKEILKFYKNLGMNIEQQIPMLLVEREALNNAREVEKDVSCHSPFFLCSFCLPTFFFLMFYFQSQTKHFISLPKRNIQGQQDPNLRGTTPQGACGKTKQPNFFICHISQLCHMTTLVAELFLGFFQFNSRARQNG